MNVTDSISVRRLNRSFFTIENFFSGTGMGMGAGTGTLNRSQKGV